MARFDSTRPFRILVCAPDHAGTLNQALGVTEALMRRLISTSSSVTDAAPQRVLMRRYRRSDAVGCLIACALPLRGPDVIVSCGRPGERKGRRLKGAYPNAFWTHVETLKEEGVAPDLCAIPAHDWTDELADGTGHDHHRMRLMGVPHRIRADDLRTSRPLARQTLGLREADHLTVLLLGGPNPAFAYGTDAIERIGKTARAALSRGALLLVPSRRTPIAVRETLSVALEGADWLDRKAGLDYRAALAAADRLAVTEDSLSMTSEAVATGRPVEAIRLDPVEGERLQKFRRFQAVWNAWLDPETGPDRSRPMTMPIPDDAGAIAERMVEMMRARA